MTVRRLASLVVSFAFASIASAQPPQTEQAKLPTGRIAGRVTAAETGKPVRWVQVRMVSQAGRQSYTATDADGRFEFNGLTPGQYRLDARAALFLPIEFGQRRPPEPGKPIDLSDGENFDKADFALPRAGAIEGVVLDEFGDPAPNITLQVSRIVYAGGRRRLIPIGGRTPNRPSDDKGQFRIYGLAPGDYYVSALSGAFTEQNETGGFAPTYYPSTPDVLAAKPVRLGFGQSMTNLIITLTPARMARLSGKLVEASGQPPPQNTVMLSLSDRQGLGDFLVARAVSAPDGSFVFRNVPPAKYVIQAFGRATARAGNLGASEFGWLPVSVDGVDQNGLTVKVAKGASARGRIVFEGESVPPLKPGEVYVQAAPVEFESSPVSGGPAPYEMRPDWTFEVSNLSGVRVLRPTPRSPDWSLKRITVDAKDVTDTPLDFRKGDVDNIEIVLTNRHASVVGTVSDGAGNPVTRFQVIVFAAESARWAFPSRFIVLGQPNQEGKFRARGLPPENYLAIAVPALASNEWQDPEFLEKNKDLATSLTLSEGETRTVALKLVTPRY